MLERQIEAVKARVAEWQTRGEQFYQVKLQQLEELQGRGSALYSKYEKRVAVFSFAAGFLYDSLTLTRIDLALDNLILLAYTLVAGILITLLGLVEYNRLRHPLVTNHLNLVNGAVHFFLGGLLSSYVVFYFKSAGVAKSYLFVGLLVALLLANEFLSDRLRNLKKLVAIYFFTCFAFLTFFLPWLINHMGTLIFFASGILSLLLILLIWNIILGNVLKQSGKRMLGLLWPPLLIFAAIVFFYFQNWMPPVPLSLRDGGIYHQVKRAGENYEARYVKPRWWQLFKSDDSDFAYTEGDTVFCYAAVFAPTKLRQRIIHQWQRLDPESGWQTTDRISYQIVGGRDGGWRGYTYKRNVTPGEWRVEVLNDDGRLLGRIALDVYAAKEKPQQFVTRLL